MPPRAVTLDPAVLEMASRPEAVTWGRTFAGAIGVGLGADPDFVADLRVAVAELVAAIVSNHSDGTIRVVGWRDAEQVAISVEPWAPVIESGEDIDPWDLVTALFDDVVEDRGRVIVRSPTP